MVSRPKKSTTFQQKRFALRVQPYQKLPPAVCRKRSALSDELEHDAATSEGVKEVNSAVGCN